MSVNYIACMKKSTRMLETSELELEISEDAKAIGAKPEQQRCPEAKSQEKGSRTILKVYQRRAKLTRANPEVVEPQLDSRIHKTESLIRKYDSATLIDAKLTDSFEFPALKRQVYMERYTTEVKCATTRIFPEFRGIQQSSILHLRNLPVFRMTGVAMKCTKFLLSRI